MSGLFYVMELLTDIVIFITYIVMLWVVVTKSVEDAVENWEEL